MKTTPPLPNGSENLSEVGTSRPAGLTSAASLTCARTTCAASSSTTSSLASAAGLSPSDLRSGQWIAPSLRAVALANRSAPQEKDSGKPPGRRRQGPSSANSSASAGFQSVLESRLRARLAGTGSPEYVLTWKHWPMKSGPQICALRARGHPTSANVSTGWPTPLVNDVTGSTHCYGPKTKDGSERSRFLKLPGAAMTAGWPTPTASDEKWRYSTHEAAQKRADSGKQASLECVAHLSGWCTPTTRDHKDGTSEGTVPTNGLLGRQVWLSPALTENRGALNPAHSRWLMGYPGAWDSCGATAMQSVRSSRQNSSKRVKKLTASDVI